MLSPSGLQLLTIIKHNIPTIDLQADFAIEGIILKSSIPFHVEEALQNFMLCRVSFPLQPPFQFLQKYSLVMIPFLLPPWRAYLYRQIFLPVGQNIH